MQILVSDMFCGFRWIVRFKDDRSLIAAGREVTVDAVGCNVQCTVLEPFDIDIARLKAGVFHFGEGLDPIDALAMFTPEDLGIGHRCGIHLIVFGLIRMGLGGQLVRWRVHLRFTRSGFGSVRHKRGSSL